MVFESARAIDHGVSFAIILGKTGVMVCPNTTWPTKVKTMMKGNTILSELDELDLKKTKIGGGSSAALERLAMKKAEKELKLKLNSEKLLKEKVILPESALTQAVNGFKVDMERCSKGKARSLSRRAKAKQRKQVAKGSDYDGKRSMKLERLEKRQDRRRKMKHVY